MNPRYKFSKEIWLATQEEEHLDICINCHLGSAYRVCVGYLDTALYDFIRFCKRVHLLYTEKFHKYGKCQFGLACAGIRG